LIPHPIEDIVFGSGTFNQVFGDRLSFRFVTTIHFDPIRLGYHEIITPKVEVEKNKLNIYYILASAIAMKNRETADKPSRSLRRTQLTKSLVIFSARSVKYQDMIA